MWGEGQKRHPNRWKQHQQACDYCQANGTPAKQCHHFRGGKTRIERKARRTYEEIVKEAANG